MGWHALWAYATQDLPGSVGTADLADRYIGHGYGAETSRPH